MRRPPDGAHEVRVETRPPGEAEARVGSQTVVVPTSYRIARVELQKLERLEDGAFAVDEEVSGLDDIPSWRPEGDEPYRLDASELGPGLEILHRLPPVEDELELAEQDPSLAGKYWTTHTVPARDDPETGQPVAAVTLRSIADPLPFEPRRALDRAWRELQDARQAAEDALAAMGAPRIRVDRRTPPALDAAEAVTPWWGVLSRALEARAHLEPDATPVLPHTSPRRQLRLTVHHALPRAGDPWEIRPVGNTHMGDLWLRDQPLLPGRTDVRGDLYFSNAFSGPRQLMKGRVSHALDADFTFQVGVERPVEGGGVTHDPCAWADVQAEVDPSRPQPLPFDADAADADEVEREEHRDLSSPPPPPKYYVPESVPSLWTARLSEDERQPERTVDTRRPGGLDFWLLARWRVVLRSYVRLRVRWSQARSFVRDPRLPGLRVVKQVGNDIDEYTLLDPVPAGSGEFQGSVQRAARAHRKVWDGSDVVSILRASGSLTWTAQLAPGDPLPDRGAKTTLRYDDHVAGTFEECTCEDSGITLRYGGLPAHEESRTRSVVRRAAVPTPEGVREESTSEDVTITRTRIEATDGRPVLVGRLERRTTTQPLGTSARAQVVVREVVYLRTEVGPDGSARDVLSLVETTEVPGEGPAARTERELDPLEPDPLALQPLHAELAEAFRRRWDPNANPELLATLPQVEVEHCGLNYYVYGSGGPRQRYTGRCLAWAPVDLTKSSALRRTPRGFESPAVSCTWGTPDGREVPNQVVELHFDGLPTAASDGGSPAWEAPHIERFTSDCPPPRHDAPPTRLAWLEGDRTLRLWSPGISAGARERDSAAWAQDFEITLDFFQTSAARDACLLSGVVRDVADVAGAEVPAAGSPEAIEKPPAPSAWSARRDEWFRDYQGGAVVPAGERPGGKLGALEVQAEAAGDAAGVPEELRHLLTHPLSARELFLANYAAPPPDAPALARRTTGLRHLLDEPLRRVREEVHEAWQEVARAQAEVDTWSHQADRLARPQPVAEDLERPEAGTFEPHPDLAPCSTQAERLAAAEAKLGEHEEALAAARLRYQRLCSAFSDPLAALPFVPVGTTLRIPRARVGRAVPCGVAPRLRIVLHPIVTAGAPLRPLQTRDLPEQVCLLGFLRGAHERVTPEEVERCAVGVVPNAPLQAKEAMQKQAADLEAAAQGQPSGVAAALRTQARILRLHAEYATRERQERIGWNVLYVDCDDPGWSFRAADDPVFPGCAVWSGVLPLGDNSQVPTEPKELMRRLERLEGAYRRREALDDPGTRTWRFESERFREVWGVETDVFAEEVEAQLAAIDSLVPSDLPERTLIERDGRQVRATTYRMPGFPCSPYRARHLDVVALVYDPRILAVKVRDSRDSVLDRWRERKQGAVGGDASAYRGEERRIDRYDALLRALDFTAWRLELENPYFAYHDEVAGERRSYRNAVERYHAIDTSTPAKLSGFWNAAIEHLLAVVDRVERYSYQPAHDVVEIPDPDDDPLSSPIHAALRLRVRGPDGLPLRVLPLEVGRRLAGLAWPSALEGALRTDYERFSTNAAAVADYERRLREEARGETRAGDLEREVKSFWKWLDARTDKLPLVFRVLQFTLHCLNHAGVLKGLTPELFDPNNAVWRTVQSLLKLHFTEALGTDSCDDSPAGPSADDPSPNAARFGLAGDGKDARALDKLRTPKERAAAAKRQSNAMQVFYALFDPHPKTKHEREKAKLQEAADRQHVKDTRANDRRIDQIDRQLEGLARERARTAYQYHWKEGESREQELKAFEQLDAKQLDLLREREGLVAGRPRRVVQGEKWARWLATGGFDYAEATELLLVYLRLGVELGARKSVSWFVYVLKIMLIFSIRVEGSVTTGFRWRTAARARHYLRKCVSRNENTHVVLASSSVLDPLLVAFLGPMSELLRKHYAAVRKVLIVNNAADDLDEDAAAWDEALLRGDLPGVLDGVYRPGDLQKQKQRFDFTDVEGPGKDPRRRNPLRLLRGREDLDLLLDPGSGVRYLYVDAKAWTEHRAAIEALAQADGPWARLAAKQALFLVDTPLARSVPGGEVVLESKWLVQGKVVATPSASVRVSPVTDMEEEAAQLGVSGTWAKILDFTSASITGTLELPLSASFDQDCLMTLGADVVARVTAKVCGVEAPAELLHVPAVSWRRGFFGNTTDELSHAFDGQSDWTFVGQRFRVGGDT